MAIDENLEEQNNLNGESENKEGRLRRRILELENQYHESEKKFQSFINNVPDAILVVNNQGTITQISKQAETLFGYTKEELLGNNINKLIPKRLRTIHEKHESNYFRSPRSRPMGVGHELFALRKDGSEFPVDISLNPTQLDGGDMVFCAVRDITERKKVEEELFKSRKLESIGVLAGGIAHDFNDLLASIIGHVSSLMVEIPPDDERYQSLVDIESASLEARERIHKLMTFAEGTHPENEIIVD